MWFSLLFQGFKGSAEREILAFFRGVLAFIAKESKDWRVREGKPGGFPTLFAKGPDCVPDPLRNVPCRCLIGREKEENDKSGTSSKKTEEIAKKSGKSQKGQKGTTDWDR